MEFVEMRDLLIQHFNEMIKDINHLFEVEVDKDEMWNLYLDSFPVGKNEIFRERRWHDCSCCRQFVKTIGNAVVIKDGKVETIWDFRTDDDTYQPVLDALSAYVKNHVVSDIYVSKVNKIGTLKNYEELNDGKILTWEHFYLELPDRLVDKTFRSEGDIKGGFRDTRNVFKRSLDEISVDAIETVMELINSNTLYKGEEWKNQIKEFLKYKKEYDTLQDETSKDLFAWEQSVKVGNSIGRIRNHSIGTLLTNITDGMNLDTAVKKYEQIIAPENYKRSKPIYTKKMLEDAQKKIVELGYMDSLNRRFATIDDISINNILFANKDAVARMQDASDIFGEMAKDVAISPKKYSKAEEVSAEKFITDILPYAKELEVLLENRLEKNMVSLIAPKNINSKTMFKWDNNFSWAYEGNLTDSSMKDRVKAAGGKVDGDLRFSIQWNEDGTDNCDLDAHCKEANGFEIYYGTSKKPYYSKTKGQLDVDIVNPYGKIAVENITWANRKTMEKGKYLFFVHQFSGRAKNGFRAEIEFDGQIYSFDYNKPMRTGEIVKVAEVILNSDNTFSINELLPSSASSKEVWGLKTNQFIPVNVVCYSPNYWNEQSGIGHKHLFFMLKECVNNENPNGFYNEFLNNELYEHRKVMEALGSRLSVEESDEQLSGVGFSMTKREEVVVKVKGSTERIFKIKF